MIITLTGKPCSGKSSVGRLFAKKYGFEFISTGDMVREIAAKQGKTILELQKDNGVFKIDHEVDSKTEHLGKTRINENIIIDSRLAWHFIPKAFKVFIDVDWDIAGNRLFEAHREEEKVSTPTQAKKLLKERWFVENNRYEELYSTSNLNLDNYDLVV